MEIAVLGLGCFWGPEIKLVNSKGLLKLKLVIVVETVKKPLTKKYVLVIQIMQKLLN